MFPVRHRSTAHYTSTRSSREPNGGDTPSADRRPPSMKTGFHYQRESGVQLHQPSVCFGLYRYSGQVGNPKRLFQRRAVSAQSLSSRVSLEPSAQPPKENRRRLNQPAARGPSERCVEHRHINPVFQKRRSFSARGGGRPSLPHLTFDLIDLSDGQGLRALGSPGSGRRITSRSVIDTINYFLRTRIQ